MDELVSRLEELTLHVVSNIGDISSEELEEFIIQRQEIINQMEAMNPQESEIAPFRSRVSQVLLHGRVISDKLIELRNEAEDQIKQIQAAANRNSLYESVPANGSFFIDKRR